jgi:hypothetical protein
MTNRRGFLGSIFAAAAAPVFVRAESLMKIYVPPQEIAYETLGPYDINSYTYRDGSTILTRQQMIDQLLPKLNNFFGIEYDRYMEQQT